MRNIQLALLAVLCVCISNAPASFVYWTNSSGSALTFDWSGGGSDKGLFGSPLVSGDTFIFSPSGFRANSEHGMPGSEYDRLEVILTSKPGQYITGIQISEFGDYGILNSGSVQVSGTLFMTNLDVFAVATANLASTPVSPITSETGDSGDWTAHAQISDLKWTHVMFVMNNNLQATSEVGSTSFIEKKVGGVSITIIPEPATLAIFAVGGLALLRKRK